MSIWSRHSRRTGTYPSLRVGVCSRSLRWGPQYFDAFAGEDRVERGGVLRIAVADQELEPVDPIAEIHHDVSGLLGDPLAGRVRCGAEDVHPPGSDLHQE